MKLFFYSFIAIIIISNQSFADAKKCKATIQAAAEAKAADNTIYVLDTNTFHHNPNVLSQFPNSHIVVPQAVLDELDFQKKDSGDRGRTARAVSASMRTIMDGHEGVNEMDYKGTKISVVELTEDAKWPKWFKDTNDNRIILVAKQVQDKHPGKKVIFITGDNALVSRAKNQGIKNVSRLENAGKAEEMDELVEDHLKVQLDADGYELMGAADRHSLSLEDAYTLGLSKEIQPRENQYLIFYPPGLKESFVLDPRAKEKEFDQHAFNDALNLVWRFHRLEDGKEVFTPVDKKEIGPMPLKPRNIEQIMLADALFDSDLAAITILGTAGTGKTLIVLEAAILQSVLLGKGRFREIILMRPNYTVGKDVGYLPGNLREKHIDLMGAFRDNLELIVTVLRADKKAGMKYLDKIKHLDNAPTSSQPKAEGEITADIIFSQKLTPKKVVERLLSEDSPFFSIEPISHSRGRSWANTLIIVDEAQNLTLHEAKTIGTRAAEGSTVIFLGDPEQIDNDKVNYASNGLVQTAHAFRIGRPDKPSGRHVSAHVNLTITERSEISKLFGQLLGH